MGTLYLDSVSALAATSTTNLTTAEPNKYKLVDGKIVERNASYNKSVFIVDVAAIGNTTTFTAAFQWVTASGSARTISTITCPAGSGAIVHTGAPVTAYDGASDSIPQINRILWTLSTGTGTITASAFQVAT